MMCNNNKNIKINLEKFIMEFQYSRDFQYSIA